MMRLIGEPREITGVALSGGPDSMALLSFLRNVNKNITAFYFNHGTEHGAEAEKWVIKYCFQHEIPFFVGSISAPKNAEDSWEEYWRKERYAFLNAQTNHIIATAHHLNDVAETYLWGTIHGHPKFIKQQINNIVRPLLLTPKSELLNWCKRHGVPFINDPSNEDTGYTRNAIRKKVIPEIELINPGFLKVVRNRWLKQQGMSHEVAD